MKEKSATEDTLKEDFDFLNVLQNLDINNFRKYFIHLREKRLCYIFTIKNNRFSANVSLEKTCFP